jgi:hypothetical protein
MDSFFACIGISLGLLVGLIICICLESIYYWIQSKIINIKYQRYLRNLNTAGTKEHCRLQENIARDGKHVMQSWWQNS